MKGLIFPIHCGFIVVMEKKSNPESKYLNQNLNIDSIESESKYWLHNKTYLLSY